MPTHRSSWSLFFRSDISPLGVGVSLAVQTRVVFFIAPRGFPADHQEQSPTAAAEHTQMADDLDDLDDYLDEFQDEVFAETDKAGEQGQKEELRDTIEETLHRLKTKEDEDESLEELLKNMSIDGDIGKALMDSMGVLMSKSVLYEPLKDITSKYPNWLAKNKDSATAEDFERYSKQYAIVQCIVDRFEAEDYDDEKDKEFISTKLDEMEATGNPPEELMGEFSNVAMGDVQLGDEDLEGCAQQ